MAYEIEVYPDARERIHSLPAGALPPLAEVMGMLKLTPWNGPPLNEVIVNQLDTALRLRLGL